MYMWRARETKERERRRDEGERGCEEGEGERGMTGVSSRAGEITHFDGIKMSVFPTPICGEIARNHALRRRGRKRKRKRGGERERENEREGGREDSPASSIFSRAILTAGVAFLPRGKRREKVPRSQSTATAFFLDVIQNVIFDVFPNGNESGERNIVRCEYYLRVVVLGIYRNANDDLHGAPLF